MKKQHWRDWGNIVLGLQVFISPWAIQHTMATGDFGTTTAVMWNTYLVGIATIVVAVAALIAFQTWEEWTNIVLGGWLLISPWVFGFSGAVRNVVGIRCGAISGNMKISFQAARSIG